MMAKRLKSTVEIYGINPEELRSLTYEKALKRKLEGVKKKYNEAVETLFKMYKDPDVPYIAFGEQNEWVKYLTKAANLTELQIAELSPHYTGE